MVEQPTSSGASGEDDCTVQLGVRLHNVELTSSTSSQQSLEESHSCRTSFRRTASDSLPEPSPTVSLLGQLAEEDDDVLLRKCFADAYAKEVAHRQSQGQNTTPSTEERRQILADILVWAEITQKHYSNDIQSFVVEPHRDDESFQRVGKFFMEAKQQLGLV